MQKRIKLFEFSEALQATALKGISKKEMESIKISVYGYTESEDYVEFSYEIEFKNEETRDFTFESMKRDKLFEDVKNIIKTSNIPILTN